MSLKINDWTVFLRLYVIPILMGIVWVRSFVFSYFCNISLSKEWSFLLKLAISFNITLLLELVLMLWDIKLAIKDYNIEKNNLFKIQSITVPFFILAAPFGIMAFDGGMVLIPYVLILFGAKSSMHYIVVAIDRHKIPAGLSQLEEI